MDSNRLYGVRVIVGDVRGKGLDAVQLGGTVLGAFRRSAFTQPSLAAIAADLDAVVTTDGPVEARGRRGVLVEHRVG